MIFVTFFNERAYFRMSLDGFNLYKVKNLILYDGKKMLKTTTPSCSFDKFSELC
jgi:hypothetical protein